MDKIELKNLGNNSHQIYHGNCFEVLDKLIERDMKVDLIICDMPFGVTNNSWDKKLNLNLVWEKIEKIKKSELTPIILFADKKSFETELYLSKKDWYRYEWTWDKLISTGFLDCAWKPLSHLEKIMVFIEKPFLQVKSRETWKKFDRIAQYFPQYTIGKPNHGTGTSTKNANTTYNSYRTSNEIKVSNMDTEFYRKDLKRIGRDSALKYPKQLLVFQKDKPNAYRKYHPTAKPVELIEYLIKTYSEENKLVLDFCAGGGSLLQAGMNTNRRTVSIEIERKYIEMIERKLKICQVWNH